MTLPVSLQGKRFSQVVEMVNWTQPLREMYQETTRNYPFHAGYCRPSGSIVDTSYPHHQEDYKPIDSCLERKK